MGFWDRVKQSVGEIVDEISVDDRVPGYLDRAQAALASNALDQAEKLLNDAALLDPKYAPTWRLLGVCQLRQRKLALAVAALERADGLKGKDFATHLWLGRAYHESGDSALALEQAKAALQSPIDEGLLEQLYALFGEIYLAEGEIDRAIRELRKAAALSGGEDPHLLGLLGEAHFRDGNLSLSRQSLQRAAAATPPDLDVIARLVGVLLALGVVDEAEAMALRLREIDGDSSRSRILLARALLAAKRPAEAQDQLLRALEAETDAPEIHRLLASVHLAIDDHQAALQQLEIARAKSADVPFELLAQLVTLKIELEQEQTLAEDAQALLEKRPEAALSLACVGLASLDDRQRALDFFARSLAVEDNVVARLGLGRLYLAEENYPPANASLRAALRLQPKSALCRRLLGESARSQSGLGLSPDADFYPTLRRAQTFFAEQPQLSSLQGATARIQQDFDRPLLIAVMGEFNSGKSTFVNALIGEEIAPMGVTPTTATINVLKYGEERVARVIWRDDREETFSWQDIGPFLVKLDNACARDVRVVELLYPAEELLRFNVVDTPGLNSMIDEHEETAREYIEQADAVIWLFSADQAGKQTEQEALDLIAKQRLKTVGVINKVDRIDPAQLETVSAHLAEGFSELVEAFIPVSARDALAALVKNDQAALVASRFVELRDYLEQRIFSRSRKIKKQVGRQKLMVVVNQALARTEASMTPLEQTDQSIEVLRETLVNTSAVGDLRNQQRRLLRKALDEAYRQAAQEVLEFVRPRGWLFGEHRASRADRDFLLELLADRLHLASAQSHRLVVERFDQQTKAITEELPAILRADGPASGLVYRVTALIALLAQQRALLEQQVYERFDAYARGFLAGGRVDHFFEVQLKKIKLELEPIYRALSEATIDVEGELLSPLQNWREQADASLLDFFDGIRHEIAMLDLDLEAGTLAPLRDLQRWLESEERDDEATG